MKATVLVDNIGEDLIQGEWGLCILIAYKGINVLLDTGASGLFAENAKKLGIALADVDYAVLSHAHYDHADGMREFFKENSKADFFLREGCKENCYGKKWIFRKYIGIAKGMTTEYKDRITYASGNYELTKGIYLIPHSTPGLAEIGRREMMYVKEHGTMRPDDFAHEQSLVFDTENGLVIFNSCSHGGADNIINEVSAAFPDKRVYALIGGFHLYNKPEADVRSIAKRIRETGIDKVYTGHCTGRKAYRIMWEELGDALGQLKAGLIMEF